MTITKIQRNETILPAPKWNELWDPDKNTIQLKKLDYFLTVFLEKLTKLAILEMIPMR
jgi:hypothetical protein